MKSIETDFDFTYERKNYRAHLSMYTPVNTPMLRVWLQLEREKEVDVFVFYKHKKGELFWFDLHDPWKQRMAEAIANTLLT